LSLIHNERTKLLASTVNTVGTATIVAGAVTPLIAATYGLPGGGFGFGTFLFSWLGLESARAYILSQGSSWEG
jgi:hypothetical protein